MTDQQIIEKLITYDQRTIQEFFFVRCRGILNYIGQYFCQDKQSAEELIGEFYEFLSADDWHKLRIFKYTCSLNSYVTIIASRYFQHKRDKETLPLDENISVVKNMISDVKVDGFFMEDMNKVLAKFQPIDRFLIQRILIEGEKPGDILDEVARFMKDDPSISTNASDEKKLAGYVYTRYNRARNSLKQYMNALGYGR